MMSILIFTGYYLPGYKGGGPIKTIKNLVENVDDFSFRIITNDRDLGGQHPYSNVTPGSWNELSTYKVYYVEPRLKGISQIIKIILNKSNNHLIYVNSFFSIKFSLIPVLLGKIFNQNIIVGPRGEFSEGALKLKATKKNVFIKFYRLLNLSNGIVFQASSKYEAQDIKRVLGSKVDIFIAEDIGAQEFVESIPIRDSKVKKSVFISRISPMKNLSLALEALKKVQKPLIYDIYGPIEDRIYWQKCQSIIADLPVNITVQYKGELLPEQVVPTLSLYDFFFMPTKGENYGHVITEALCAGLPLVISNTTPWRNLESLGIGWDLPLDNLDSFSKTIDKLIEMSDDELRQMRESIVTWARYTFTQRNAIDANIAMFHYAYNKKRKK